MRTRPIVGYLVQSWRRQRRMAGGAKHSSHVAITRTRQGALRLVRDLEHRGRYVEIVVLTKDDTGRLYGEVFLHWPPRLRQIRIDLDLTQSDLACELKVSERRLAKWEQGRSTPRRQLRRRLLALEHEAAQEARREPEALDRACLTGPIRVVRDS